MFSTMSSEAGVMNLFLGLILGRIKAMMNLLGIFPGDMHRLTVSPNEARELPCPAPIASLILLFRARRMLFFSSLPEAVRRLKIARIVVQAFVNFTGMCLFSPFNLNESLRELYHGQNLIDIISRRMFNRQFNTKPHIPPLTFRLGQGVAYLELPTLLFGHLANWV